MVEIKRETKETKISLSLNLYGEGKSEISTKIGFFDHMLEALSKHSLMDLKLICDGDVHVDFHHSVEDVGIALGEALKKELFPVKSIERFGEASIILDEACVNSVIDISNRPYLYYDLPLEHKIGEFDGELAEEFFRAVAVNAGISLHMSFIRGKNRHHIIEAAFKSFAVALRRAVTPNSKIQTPSTKGVL